MLVFDVCVYSVYVMVIYSRADQTLSHIQFAESLMQETMLQLVQDFQNANYKCIEKISNALIIFVQRFHSFIYHYSYLNESLFRDIIIYMCVYFKICILRCL